jgi:hypothetical protein
LLRSSTPECTYLPYNQQSIDKVPLFARVVPPDGRSNSKARAAKPEGGSEQTSRPFILWGLLRFQLARPEPRTAPGYPATFFACAFILAHRRLAALEIFAFTAADITCFFTLTNSRPVLCPSAFAAARTPSNWCCILCNCFSSFRSSRLIAARMFIQSLRRKSISTGQVALVVLRMTSASSAVRNSTVLMVPRDYSSCTSALARICGSMNLAMSAQRFVGGLGAVAPETAAFFDTGCRSCAICKSCKGFICRVLG